MTATKARLPRRRRTADWRPLPTEAHENESDRDAWIDCGWGRLIFAHTFEEMPPLLELLRAEAPDERDIAFYVSDPHVALAMAPQGIVLSPGPCDPDKAGICLELVAAAAGRLPMLGVCLGFQAIGQAFGGTVVRAEVPMHGKLSRIHHARALLCCGTRRRRILGRSFFLVAIVHHRTAIPAIEMMRPEVYAKGHTAEGMIPEETDATIAAGGRVVFMPPDSDGYSQEYASGRILSGQYLRSRIVAQKIERGVYDYE